MQDHSFPKVGSSNGCRAVDPHLVRQMQAMVTHLTDEALNAQFGISYNTWRKLIAGKPVRASLLARLEARLASLGAKIVREST